MSTAESYQAPGFLSKPKSAYVFQIASTPSQRGLTTQLEVCRYLSGHLSACRPKSLVALMILGSLTSNSRIHKEFVATNAPGIVTGYEGIELKSIGPSTGEKTLIPLETSDILGLSGDDIEVNTSVKIDFLSSIIAALKEMETSVLTKAGVPTKLLDERRVVVILPKECLSSPEFLEDDSDTFLTIRNMVNELLAEVDIVLCDTNEQEIDELHRISPFCQYYQHWDNIRVYSSDTYKSNIVEWNVTGTKPPKPRAKRRYELTINSELSIPVESHLLTSGLKLPTTARVSKCGLHNIEVDQVYLRVKNKVPNTELDHVPTDELKKAYKYGNYLVPIGEAENQFLNPGTLRGLKLRGRIHMDSIDPRLYMKSDEIIYPYGSIRERSALRSMCCSLKRRNEGLLVDSVFNDGNQPHLAVLVPVSYKTEIAELDMSIDESKNYACLLLHNMPWQENIRLGVPVVMPGLRNKEERTSRQVVEESQKNASIEMLRSLPNLKYKNIKNDFPNPIIQKFSKCLMESLCKSIDDHSTSDFNDSIIKCQTYEATAIEKSVPDVKKEFNISAIPTMKEKAAANEAALMAEDEALREKVNLSNIKLEPTVAPTEVTVGIDGSDLKKEIRTSIVEGEAVETIQLDAAATIAEEEEEAEEDIGNIEEAYDFQINFDEIF